MSVTVRMIVKYLEECASLCPHCGKADDESPIRRAIDHGSVARSDEEVPAIRVPCYCAACGRGWIEVYRLEDVEFPEGSS